MASSTISTFWPALETVRGLQAVPAVWHNVLRSDFECVARYIRPIQEIATLYPCLEPGACGFPHRVIHHALDDIVAVSEAGDGECDELTLRQEDIVIHELNVARLGKDLAAALELLPAPCHHDILQTRVIGAVASDRGALPVAFGIYADEQALMIQTQRLRAAIPAGAIVLLIPTGRLLIPATRERLTALGFHPVPLEGICLIDQSGRLEAKSSLQHHLELSLPVAMVGMAGSIVSPSKAPTISYQFVKKGDVWEVAYEETRTSIKDINGMTYIHILLSHPNNEFRAFDVAQMAEGRGGEHYQDDGGEVADHEYLMKYGEKINHLKERLEEAITFGRHEDQELLEAELENLLGFEPQLKGQGGRARRTNSTTERSRNIVRKAVNRALESIREKAPELHHHLKNSVQLGTRCVYRPDRPIDWHLR